MSLWIGGGERLGGRSGSGSGRRGRCRLQHQWMERRDGSGRLGAGTGGGPDAASGAARLPMGWRLGPEGGDGVVSHRRRGAWRAADQPVNRPRKNKVQPGPWRWERVEPGAEVKRVERRERGASSPRIEADINSQVPRQAARDQRQAGRQAAKQSKVKQSKAKQGKARQGKASSIRGRRIDAHNMR
ncbi:uncharacterized protein K452DRAFT_165762 [Aplosporella prunicola CBS 121167]|uniref:Uncharacterized protein n=1 Tax=Aplosporella prunicola CBS 121167 TaxID=1176127 RepID=A0A6A6AUT9_9PEZI|nr:uncharacterized protein K452DRAFT_165762 [Aplosporella prunicola CBS 121167]KAF2135699.1 hypothetical protein K452DRAFT_165762 [Aplosporella prunicola CBS 121167]